jgi:hypothetical protein
MPEIDWQEPVENEPGFREALKPIAEPNLPESAWRTLADRMVHQYDIDDTAIKALPILVAIASRISPEERFRHLALIGLVAYCSQLPGSRWVMVSAPNAVQQALHEALEKSATLVAECLLEHWDLIQTRYLLQAYAAVRGHSTLADHLEMFGVVFDCPKCGNRIELPTLLDSNFGVQYAPLPSTFRNVAGAEGERANGC